MTRDLVSLRTKDDGRLIFVYGDHVRALETNGVPLYVHYVKKTLKVGEHTAVDNQVSAMRAVLSFT